MEPDKLVQGSKGKGRGRGRGSRHPHTLQPSREAAIAEWVQEAQLENLSDRGRNCEGQCDDIPISSSSKSSSATPSPVSNESTTTPSSSSPSVSRGTLADLRPSLPAGFVRGRGRGRARGIVPEDNESVQLGSGSSISTPSPTPVIEVSIEGPLRNVEDVLPSVADAEDSFVAKFRKLGQPPTNGARTGLARGVQSMSLEGETLVLVQPEESSSSPSTSPLSVSKSTTELSSTASSEIGSEDFSHLEKATVIRKGNKGSKIRIATNYIRLRVDKDKGYFEYHVDFEPIMDSLRFKKKLVYNHQDVLGKVRNFDGAKLFLPFKLDHKVTTLRSPHPINPEQEVTMKIKYVKRNTFGGSVHFYNILFRRIMNILGMVEMGRNHYDYSKTFNLPQHKLEIWPGFVTAIDEYEDGLMLCCDTSFRVLRTSTLLEVLERIRNSSPRSFQEDFTNAVLNKVVLTRHNNKSYCVDDVVWDQSPMDTFTRRGEEISYMDYYEQNHKIKIKDRNQPLLVSRPKLRNPRNGDENTLICLIPELCFETGLSAEITSEYTIMKDISSFTRVSPQQRFLSLQTFVKNVQDNPDATEILEQWGLRIDDVSIHLDARVINAPNLDLNSRFTLKSAPHEFSRELTKNHIMKPIQVSHWLVLCVSADAEKANRFVLQYRQVTPSLGIGVAADGRVIQVPGRGNVDDFKRTIEMHANSQIQFLVIILPNSRGDVYSATKIQTLVDKAIPTQMILAKTLSSEKKLRAIVVKIALQINCKLGGYLWSLRIPLDEKIMFVGMDVYHDPKNKSASCTGLVASMNGQHTKYFSRVIFQKPKQETTDSITAAYVQAIQAFKQENGAFPDRVVVFRDGVGDGQLDLTRQHEVDQFKSAMDYTMGHQPKFTFTVVQKRIHTRIYKEAAGKFYENPRPGTVLDHTVTRKYLFDFFLVSQFVRDGTVMPSHFIVLEDNSSISPDLIQKFAFASSFMYYNWPGTIRVPAVCQYAHKLAFLVGQHLKMEPSELLAKQLYFL